MKRSLRSGSVLAVLAGLLAACSHSGGSSAPPPMPAVPLGSAVIVAGVSTSHQPCTGAGFARYYVSGQCFRTVGAPIVRAADFASATAMPKQFDPFWLSEFVLRPAAAARFDRYRAGHAGTVIVFVSGSVVLDTSPVTAEPLHGEFSLGDMTENDARRIVDALTGPRTGHDPVSPPTTTSG